MSIYTRINTELEKSTPDADKLAELKGDLQAERLQLQARFNAIKGGDWPGPEYRAALVSGDVDKAMELDEERRKVNARLSAVQTIGQRLDSALQHAKARQAVELMPDRLAKVDELLQVEADMLQKLQAARRDTDAALKEIRKARTDCRRVDKTAPEGNADTLREFLRVRGITWDDKNGFGANHHLVTRVADDLALPDPTDRPRFAAIG